MKVLITGGTGTISSGLVYESVKRNFETYAITRGYNNRRNIKGANYLHADIWNHENVKSVIGTLKFDVVIECLAYNISQLKKSLENFADITNQYIFISTAAVYNRVEDRRIVEDDPKEFVEWTYTKNKIECEHYLKEYSKITGLKYTIVRPTVTYGNFRIPFPIATRSPGWTFFERMRTGQLMLASNNVNFSIIHISDFSRMVVSLFHNDQATNEDFHITSDKNNIYWDDVMVKSGEILNVEPKIVHVSSKVIKHIWPDIYDEIVFHKNTPQIFDGKKIKNATDEDAEIDLVNGLNKTISAMRSEYINNHLTVDMQWNEYCDATIYYAYIHNELSETEKNIVAEYIDKHTDTELKKSYRRVRKRNLTFRTKQVKRKIKYCIKRILKINHE